MAPSADSLSDASASAGPPQQAAAPPRDLWTSLYGFFLLGLIVAYYAVMIYFAGELLRWSVAFIQSSVGAQSLASLAVNGAAAAILATLLIRTVWHLIYASAGLVTPMHESVPEATEGIEISREEYPELFALIDRVGEAVGAPRPDEVRVHHAPESFTLELRRFGIRPQRRLILVLSVPQLGVLTEAELGVILAHELSHFGCGYTRLVVFLDRFLNSLRMATETVGQRWWHWVDPIYWFQFCYLRALILLSAPLQRHQELRADSVSANVFGGELAARTLLKDWLLSNQFLTALGSFEPSDNGQPPGNVFGWFRNRWRDFSTAGEDYLLRRLEAQQKPSFWSDDPTIPQRVQLMRKFPRAKEAAPSRPVRDIIGDLDALEDRLHDRLIEA